MKSDGKKFVVYVGHHAVAAGNIQQANRLMEMLSEMQAVDESYIKFADTNYGKYVFFPTNDRLRVDQVEHWAESREVAKLIELEQAKLIKARDEAETPPAPPVAVLPSAASPADLVESF